MDKPIKCYVDGDHGCAQCTHPDVDTADIVLCPRLGCGDYFGPGPQYAVVRSK